MQPPSQEIGKVSVIPRYDARLISQPISQEILIAIPTLVVLLFCVGCSSRASSYQNIQPPGLTYSATTIVGTKGTAITPDVPNNTGGAVLSYSVVPGLPGGLSLDFATGIISGTPTVVAAQMTYIVTGSNAGGRFSVDVTITVNDIAPSGLTYGTNPAVFSAAAAITPDVPSWSTAGGTPTSFAVQGLLPQGLSLDPVTGVISGTPTTPAPQANYIITATNTGGNTSATLTLTILPQAPYIAVQPASQYVGSGIATYFAVSAGGGGILTYQWYKNGAPIASSNSNVYQTPVLSTGDNGEQFHVTISDNYSRSVTSNAATLTIKGVSGTFVNTGTPGTARECNTATLLQNGKVLIAGGRDGNAVLSSAEIFDPSTSNFTPTGSLTTPRCGQSATLLANGKVLVAGGYDSGSTGGLPTLSTAELYDPSTGKFSATGSLGTGRAGHSATLLANGKVLVAGGANSNDGFTFFTLSSAELYDPTAGTFSATGSLNTPRSAPASLLTNGKVLIAGGSNLTSGPLSSAELYDPTAGTFSLTGSLTTARSGHSMTLLQNGKVLVAGGDNDGGVIFLTSAELYDSSTGTFTATGSLNNGRENQTATLLSNGQVLMVGGNVEAIAQPELQMTELYDPASGVFIFNAATNSSRVLSTATPLTSGQVLVTGQETPAIGANPVPAELYQP